MYHFEDTNHDIRLIFLKNIYNFFGACKHLMGKHLFEKTK